MIVTRYKSIYYAMQYYKMLHIGSKNPPADPPPREGSYLYLISLSKTCDYELKMNEIIPVL